MCLTIWAHGTKYVVFYCVSYFVNKDLCFRFLLTVLFMATPLKSHFISLSPPTSLVEVKGEILKLLLALNTSPMRFLCYNSWLWSYSPESFLCLNQTLCIPIFPVAFSMNEQKNAMGRMGTSSIVYRRRALQTQKFWLSNINNIVSDRYKQ